MRTLKHAIVPSAGSAGTGGPPWARGRADWQREQRIMHFFTRAVIALLSGIGAGLIGFWVSWNAVWAITGEHPGIGHDHWLVAGIFVPGAVVPLVVFGVLSRAVRPTPR
jgi:hypothetical protein